eukprot:6179076-Pleurochrysis_carterae.AAC.3
MVAPGKGLDEMFLPGGLRDLAPPPALSPLLRSSFLESMKSNTTNKLRVLAVKYQSSHRLLRI